jgi:ribulose-phosphate 3-epimerase
MSPLPLQTAPSLMCANFLRLEEDLDALRDGGISWWHIDIMDGHFVPNFTLGPDFCRAVARHRSLPLDIHLMVEPVEKHLERFLEFKGSRISFHPETAQDAPAVIRQIKDAGCRPGIAISPSIPVDSLAPLLPEVDYVCVMTINPGFAGQKLIPACLPKITEVRDFYRNHGLVRDIEVDGNVSWENIPKMVTAGANILVTGTSSIFVKDIPLAEGCQKMNAVLAGLAAAR